MYPVLSVRKASFLVGYAGKPLGDYRGIPRPMGGGSKFNYSLLVKTILMVGLQTSLPFQ